MNFTSHQTILVNTSYFILLDLTSFGFFLSFIWQTTTGYGPRQNPDKRINSNLSVYLQYCAFESIVRFVAVKKIFCAITKDAVDRSLSILR